MNQEPFPLWFCVLPCSLEATLPFLCCRLPFLSPASWEFPISSGDPVAYGSACPIGGCAFLHISIPFSWRLGVKAQQCCVASLCQPEKSQPPSCSQLLRLLCGHCVLHVGLPGRTRPRRDLEEFWWELFRGIWHFKRIAVNKQNCSVNKDN